MHQKIPIIHHHSSTSSNYIELIDACIKGGVLKSGRALHAHLIINGLAGSLQFVSKLIAFYTRCKELAAARKVFDLIPKSKIRGWAAVIGSYARNGYYEEAMGAFEEMQKVGFNHDRIVLPSVLKACAQLSDWKTGEKIHAVVLKNEFEADAFVMCALIDMYSKCGMVEKAKRVFDVMVDKDLVALNAMVSGYVQNDSVQEALNLVEEMKFVGVKPDIVTWNTLISGFSQANDEVMVSKIFQTMETDGVKPDAISWTSVISGLVQNFRSTRAYSAFGQMLKAGFSPTASTISSLLPACATIADLRRGKEIHGYSVVMGFAKDVYVRSALIDMYAKCGLISEAMSLFHGMSERNTVTWNSMIFGYANHGYCHEAIQLFSQMVREEERKLDHLTFTAALTACTQAGMVDLGESLFQLMQQKYKIVPRTEHYACMVDLLGRAGKLDEAYDLIQRMPVDPDSFVWGALLGACRQHDRADLAEVAAEQLAKLEPKSSGSSTLLLNLYADSGRWGNAVKLKKMMKERKLRSFPSRSWIEVL
ncbi:UNVERIFIED_CONTAM: Pentatricopeptide repeat-containing protein [Sesamum radiatum]|uniref:Pentatricopeptide repeat-containing protein n=1 Tax=Sesamum radiatum TaxID=300843 RepID=A0AAW2URC6_SESRA